jgi:hypothetical protein
MLNMIGFSGLHHSAPFKCWPNLAAEYRIPQGFESAAALVTNGEIRAAASEESFNREKATGSFPVQAIKCCLAEAASRPATSTVSLTSSTAVAVMYVHNFASEMRSHHRDQRPWVLGVLQLSEVAHVFSTPIAGTDHADTNHRVGAPDLRGSARRTVPILCNMIRIR